MSAPTPFLTACLLLLAACSSAPQTKRPLQVRAPGESADAGPGPDDAGRTRAPDPERSPATTAGQERHVLRSGSGATVLVRPDATGLPGDTAELHLSIRAGAEDGRRGLAHLTAETVVEGVGPSPGQASLRQTVAGLGGSLESGVGPRSSWFHLRVPRDKWRDALRALVAAISEPPTARQRLERIRDGLIARRAESFGSTPALVGAFALGEGGPAEFLAALQDRDPAEMLLFLRSRYRPEGAILALAVPGGDSEQVGEAAASELAQWPTVEIAPDPEPSPPRPPVSGIHWVPSEAPCTATLVFALPDLLEPDAAPLLVLQECLTTGGVGGRLQRTLLANAQDRTFTPELLDLGGRRWLALTAEMPSDRVTGLWELVRSTRASLRSIPPSDSERAQAADRAMLMLRAARSTPRERLQEEIELLRRGLEEDPLETQLAALAAGAALRLSENVDAWLGLPMALLVVGGEPPEDESVTLHGPVSEEVVDKLLGRDLKTQIEAAQPYMERTLQALGGAHKLAAVRGFKATAEIGGFGAPTATEEVVLTGTELRRTRTVLGTTVSTVVAGGHGVETAGGVEVELEPREVASLMRNVNRNPLMLLAAHARGRLAFRLVSVRRIDGRETAILEAVASPYARLRLHIDVESHLPRTMETWQEDQGESWFYLRERFLDYRYANGIRVPFHRLTDVDDSSERLETVVTSIEVFR